MIDRWKEEGHPEGRDEGRLSAFRTSIADILNARFGSTPDSLQEALARVSDPAHLKNLAVLAVTRNSVDVFLRSLDD